MSGTATITKGGASASASVSVATVPSYILASLPSAAVPISQPSQYPTATTSPPRAHVRAREASFPPTSTTSTASTASSSKSKLPLGSISTNVSDLLLSSLLPPNLPKLPTTSSSAAGGSGAGAAAAAEGGKGGVNRGRGVPRELSTQREALSLPLVSNNFRRFVTRVGPVFYLQDRVEEVLFWRKPTWTWAWIITWTFISFQPRTLLVLPSLTLLVILLHIHERSVPLPSLLGTSLPTASATDRIAPDGRRRTSLTRDTSPAAKVNGEVAAAAGSSGFTATTTRDADGETVGIPAVPPKEAESGVDYYMNLQAIQNLMGLVSDAYDEVAPRLAALQSTSPSPPTSLPFTPTHMILLILPPTLLLPLAPSSLIPYILLPLGILPPLLFHPDLPTSLLTDLPRHPVVRKIRAYAEGLLLDDTLSDDIGRKEIARVEVWENERLEPKIASSLSSSNASQLSIPVTAWSTRHLRASDRPAWVKVVNASNGGGSKWKSTDDTVPLPASEKEQEKEVEGENVLALKEGWAWIPGEDWRVDVCGLWSEMGVDNDGWVYSDDSWQNPAPTPITEADSPLGGPGTMPVALRRVTRRRRWWRRVYEVAEEGV